MSACITDGATWIEEDDRLEAGELRVVDVDVAERLDKLVEDPVDEPTAAVGRAVAGRRRRLLRGADETASSQQGSIVAEDQEVLVRHRTACHAQK